MFSEFIVKIRKGMIFMIINVDFISKVLKKLIELRIDSIIIRIFERLSKICNRDSILNNY